MIRRSILNASIIRFDFSSCDGYVFTCDNLELLKLTPDNFVDLIYIDPPFNTGKEMTRRLVKSIRSEDGNEGFGGNKYKVEVCSISSYNDKFDDYLSFLYPRLVEAKRVLKNTGSLYFHIDYREVHYCKILLDEIFGRENFINEIIWAFDYGGKPRNKWPAKHNNILFYVKDKDNYYFDQDACDRIPYMSPDLVSKEKAEKGKLPTDVWWHTIVPTNSKEKTGYPTQKPIGILKRIVSVSSPPNGIVLDFFAGSGSIGVAALELGRKFVLCDNNPEAIRVMRNRLGGKDVLFVDLE